MSTSFSDLITRFNTNLQMATDKGHPEPTAMTLSTVNEVNAPSSRVVLLKNLDERGFVFYTNLGSRKAREIQNNPNVSLNFMWHNIERQIRVEGVAQQVSDEEADTYFASRARQSQIGAWASLQSNRIEEKRDFEKRIAKFGLKYAIGKVPRPDFWSGYLIVPSRIEFWQKRDFRLHERFVFERNQNDTWDDLRLYP
jgi:pyridoxamine 5'-phosphate oxidase